MTKRMKRIAALLTCGLVLASGTSVYAGNAEGTLLGYPISLEVSVRKASAMTAGSYPKTTIYPYRYATGGSANFLPFQYPIHQEHKRSPYRPQKPLSLESVCLHFHL